MSPEEKAERRDYMRQWRRSQSTTRSALRYPLHSPRYDIGVGATIARSFRESA